MEIPVKFLCAETPRFDFETDKSFRSGFYTKTLAGKQRHFEIFDLEDAQDPPDGSVIVERASYSVEFCCCLCL